MPLARGRAGALGGAVGAPASRCSACAWAPSCWPQAAGGRCRRRAEPEIGWREIRLGPAPETTPSSAGCRDSFSGFQWHSYEAVPPSGSMALARSNGSLQAFRLEGRSRVGHPVPRRGGRTDRSEGWIARLPQPTPTPCVSGVDPEALRAETAPRIAQWNELGRELLRALPGLAADALLGREVGAREPAVDQEGRWRSRRSSRRWQGTGRPARSRLRRANRPGGRCTRRRAAFCGSLANSSRSRGVSTGPGQSAFTRSPGARTPRPSRATWRAPRPSTPCRRSGTPRRPSPPRTRPC